MEPEDLVKVTLIEFNKHHNVDQFLQESQDDKEKKKM